ncbi:MAG: hypothetical protein DRJ02_11510 [Bacteroidetes bacterium]|nr:MAG: hypothetical protein DRI87_07890 [Bacteroidota bacterium]RLD84790.1 MAG: hypothetical protein DRJ02_11510 [Bacteroidota bacterium]
MRTEKLIVTGMFAFLVFCFKISHAQNNDRIRILKEAHRTLVFNKLITINDSVIIINTETNTVDTISSGTIEKMVFMNGLNGTLSLTELRPEDVFGQINKIDQDNIELTSESGDNLVIRRDDVISILFENNENILPAKMQSIENLYLYFHQYNFNDGCLKTTDNHTYKRVLIDSITNGYIYLHNMLKGKYPNKIVNQWEVREINYYHNNNGTDYNKISLLTNKDNWRPLMKISMINRPVMKIKYYYGGRVIKDETNINVVKGISFADVEKLNKNINTDGTPYIKHREKEFDLEFSLGVGFWKGYNHPDFDVNHTKPGLPFEFSLNYYFNKNLGFGLAYNVYLAEGLKSKKANGDIINFYAFNANVRFNDPKSNIYFILRAQPGILVNRLDVYVDNKLMEGVIKPFAFAIGLIPGIKLSKSAVLQLNATYLISKTDRITANGTEYILITDKLSFSRFEVKAGILLKF